MTDRELMQQALDALNHKNVKDRMQVITALRERLAQDTDTCPPCNHHCRQGRDCPARRQHAA